LNPDALRAICFEPPEVLTIAEISERLRQKYVRQWQINLVIEGLIDTLAAEQVVAKELESESSVGTI
jgi:uncharacterized protein with von Willebrand factor type A (vWA) domain